MAGLLDIFGTGGTQTLGLLGMSPEDIQSNRNDAQAQALYGLAARLFQGGNTGQSIAEGLQQGQKLYSSAMQNQLQEQLQGFQMKDLLEKRKREEQALARQAMIDKAVAGSYQPGIAAVPAQMVEEDGRYMGETPAVAGRAAGLNLQTLLPILQASPEGRKTLTELMASQKAMAGETTSLAENAKLIRTNPFTGETTVVATGMPKEKATPSDIQGYELAKSQGFGGSFLDYQTALKKAGATSINMPGEGERKAATLASRLNFSVGQMNEAIGKEAKAAMPNTASEIARFVTRTDFLPNKLNSEQRQIVEAAQEDVLDAALTLGTGAAYSREQLAGYKKSYFPQLGDSDATVKTKQDRLLNLLKSAEVASGRAVNQITTPVPKPTAPSATPTAGGLPSLSAIDAEIERRKAGR